MHSDDLPLRVELHVEGEQRHIAFINSLGVDSRSLAMVQVGDKICVREESRLVGQGEHRIAAGCYSVTRRVWDFFPSEESQAGSAYLSVFIQKLPF